MVALCRPLKWLWQVCSLARKGMVFAEMTPSPYTLCRLPGSLMKPPHPIDTSSCTNRDTAAKQAGARLHFAIGRDCSIIAYLTVKKTCDCELSHMRILRSADNPDFALDCLVVS
jgi:hypothetical protein